MLQRETPALTRLMGVTLENSRHTCRRVGVPRLPGVQRGSPHETQIFPPSRPAILHGPAFPESWLTFTKPGVSHCFFQLLWDAESP